MEENIIDQQEIVSEQVIETTDDSAVVTKEKDGSIKVTQKVDPIVVEVNIEPDDWESCGTCWRAEIEAPELYEDGVTSAYLNEDKMKEESKYISYTMKYISDIYAEDDFDPVMNAKTEKGKIIFDWNRNEKPKVPIIFTVEQLPFF